MSDDSFVVRSLLSTGEEDGRRALAPDPVMHWYNRNTDEWIVWPQPSFRLGCTLRDFSIVCACHFLLSACFDVLVFLAAALRFYHH